MLKGEGLITNRYLAHVIA